MRKILVILAISVCSISIGQQIPQFSQYFRNQNLVNPAATGVYDFLDITAGGRMQWLGFKDAPMTSYLYGSSVVNKKTKSRYNPSIRIANNVVPNPEVKTGKLKHAVGGLFLVDQYGAYRQLKLAGTYSLHIPMTEEINLSFGTSLGLSNRAFLQDKVQTLDVMTLSGPIDQAYSNYSQQANQNTVDLGFGLYLYSNDFFAGLSVEQVTKDLISFESGYANYDPRMYFNALAGYKFELTDNLTVMPTIMAKYMRTAPLSIEGSFQLEYNESMWFGMSYRKSDAIVLMAGMNISEKYKFGYSFDYSVSEFNSHSSFGHEIVLGIMLGRQKNDKTK